MNSLCAPVRCALDVVRSCAWSVTRDFLKISTYVIVILLILGYIVYTHFWGPVRGFYLRSFVG